MLIIIAIVLAGLWLVGLLVDFAGSLIHVVLLVAAIVIVYDLLTSRQKT